MKKLIAILTTLIVLVSFSSISAVEVNYISTSRTASAAVLSGQYYFYGIIVKTDGTNNVTLNIYDNTAASGKRLIPTNFVIPGTDYYFGYKPPEPIQCALGVYVAVSVAGGGSCSYQVLYGR